MSYEINTESPEELERTLFDWLESYDLGFPQVPDDVYDNYKRQLKIIKPESKFFDRIGITPKKNKESLPFICGSLKNKTMDDIEDWLKKRSDRNGFVLSHKLDGISLETQWDNGVFTKAWLRGDGYYGENVTEKAKKFLPPKLDFSNSEFRSPYLTLPPSIIMTHEILLNCEPEEIGYKNKRNSVSGIMHRDDDMYLDKLYCLAHVWKNPNNLISDDELVRMTYLSYMIPTVPFLYVSDWKDVISSAENMIKNQTQYDKDGIVICARLGKVENVKFPENKIAFKFNKQVATSEVKLIDWNVSRTGRIVPLVWINPVDLGGVTIGKATAFNAKFMRDKKINIGSQIKVCRSGDVIPYIEEVIETKEPTLPTSCPSCNESVVWDATQTHLRCNNPDCPDVVKKRITYFFIMLGLEFFSEKMISSLKCGSIFDIYKLTEKDILQIEGWGESSARDFIRRIQATKETTPEKLITSLGIEGVAQSTAKSLLDVFAFDELIALTEKDINRITAIKGFATKKATSVIQGLSENRQFLMDLFKAGIGVKQKVTGPLTGLSFEITGALSKPRKKIVEWIESAGGRHESLAKCNYLICNENPSDSDKYKLAKKKDIPIITEEQLIEMYMQRKK